MEREPSVIFGGRKVDLRTAEDLSRYFRQDVLRLVHAYFDVNVDILSRTVQDDPPGPDRRPRTTHTREECLMRYTVDSLLRTVPTTSAWTSNKSWTDAKAGPVG